MIMISKYNILPKYLKIKTVEIFEDYQMKLIRIISFLTMYPFFNKIRETNFF